MTKGKNDVVSGDWKVGQSVNIGTLRGLVVTGVTQEGSLQKFTLKHPTTQKEYTFVPGGLRKTYEPPAPVASDAHNMVIASNALDRAKSILATRCRRHADAAVRADLQEVISLLSSAAVGGGASNVVEAPAAVVERQPAGDF